MRKNLVKFVFALSLGISSLAILGQESDAKYVETVTVSYLEHISPTYYKSDYYYKDLSFINGYTRTESVKQVESTLAQLAGISTLKHSFTYKTY